MAVFRHVAVVLSLAWLVLAAPLASAGSLETCAQRVIRDWYSGGRVDRVYPLPCYRAAISALPADVLAYSEADADIARALAFARRGRDGEGDAPVADEPVATSAAATAETTDEAASSPPGAAAAARRAKDAGSSAEPSKRSTRFASGPRTADVSSAVPYPVIVLAALAGTLLLTGAAGWAVARRR
jgi:cobalamin biosynthesis Mg chelatase CobN